VHATTSKVSKQGLSDPRQLPLDKSSEVLLWVVVTEACIQRADSYVGQCPVARAKLELAFGLKPDKISCRRCRLKLQPALCSLVASSRFAHANQTLDTVSDPQVEQRIRVRT
jgi:hypothetical protein